MHALTTVDPAKIRSPAVAGRFYPSDPTELRGMIRGFLESAPEPTASAPKAVIAPHAGYPYSGPIAASAYARLMPGRDLIKRVVLLGPSHFVPVQGLAASSAGSFATPLGKVPVDVEALMKLGRLPQVHIVDEAHAREHSLEVQLPFLQTVLNQFSIVPLVVGEASPRDVSEVIEMLWGGPETCFVISSDLSHYYEAQVAQKLDRATADAIEALAPDRIGEEQACGRFPIRGLLESALQHRLRARTVDLRNSGDTAGPRHQVVGYGAFVFDEH